MSLGFANLAMLAALAAVFIPLLVHLLRRRRHPTVDWGAMQFLHFSRRRRPRLQLEELLLMLLRMGLVALFVLALAGPYSESLLLPDWTSRESKDVVLVLDVSASMGYDDGKNPTPLDQARRWAESYLDELGDRDRVALLTPPLPLQAWPQAADPAALRSRLAEPRAPRGVADWPAAVEKACQFLKAPDRNPRQQIILLKDRQAFGWSDADTLPRWQALVRRLQGQTLPPIQAIEFGPLQPTAPNLSLAPLRAAPHLPVVGQSIRFRTALQLDNVANYQTPRQIRVEVNGRPIRDLPPPALNNLVKGQIPLSFELRLTQPGSQVVSVVLDPGQSDSLARDNRQDQALEVADTLPILLVDGAERSSAGSGTFFLDKALRSILPENIQKSLRNVSYLDWDPAAPQGKPRMIVLADVPFLRNDQVSYLKEFSAEGGGVLILAGARAGDSIDSWNQLIAKAGWLPAGLDKIVGSSQERPAPTLDLRRGSFSPLQVFRGQSPGALAQAPFPKWWQLAPTPGAAFPVAWLSNGDPWLVERAVGRGRVLLCATPLDRSWQATLPTLPEFPILIHELTSHLIDSSLDRLNLAPGTPFHWIPGADQLPPRVLFITGPDNETYTQHSIRENCLVFPEAGPGAYLVASETGEIRRFVSAGDARESDLTPCTEEERNQVSKYLSLTDEKTLPSATQQDLWWLFLLGVVMLLMAEIYLTRRMAHGKAT